MAARPTIVKARICWKSAVEVARLIDAGIAICSIFGEGGSWGGRIDSGGSRGVVFNASNRFGTPLAGARFFFGFLLGFWALASSMPPASTTPQARPQRGPPPHRLRRRLHRGDHAGTRPRNWTRAESMSRWLCCCRALRRGQIVHAPAGVCRTIFCHSSRRTIAVGPWGHDSDAEARILLPQPASPVSNYRICWQASDRGLSAQE
jgi:hypothetical protein